MSDRKQLLLGIEPDLPLPLSALMDMLRLVRTATLRAVEGLSVGQLDQRHDEKSNSIGSLLWHIAAVERWYQVNSFEEREWTAEDAAEWDVALDFSDAARAFDGRPLDSYVELLTRIRSRTEEELRRRDVAWLLRVSELDEKTDANNYWKWFHVCEDEIGHQAQIRWLKKRLV